MWTKYYEGSLTQRLHESIIRLCLDHMPKDMPLEVDAIVCISAGNNNNIVVKVHEMLNDGADCVSVSESESVEETAIQPMPFTKLLADKDSETSQLSQLGLLNRATKRRTKEPSRQNQAKASRQSKAQDGPRIATWGNKHPPTPIRTDSPNSVASPKAHTPTDFGTMNNNKGEVSVLTPTLAALLHKKTTVEEDTPATINIEPIDNFHVGHLTTSQSLLKEQGMLLPAVEQRNDKTLSITASEVTRDNADVIINQSNNAIYNCKECDIDLTSYNYFELHNKAVHKMLTCQECSALFTNNSGLRVHMEREHQIIVRYQTKPQEQRQFSVSPGKSAETKQILTLVERQVTKQTAGTLFHHTLAQSPQFTTKRAVTPTNMEVDKEEQVKRHITTVECEECGGEFDNESDWMTHKCKDSQNNDTGQLVMDLDGGDSHTEDSTPVCIPMPEDSDTEIPTPSFSSLLAPNTSLKTPPPTFKIEQMSPANVLMPSDATNNNTTSTSHCCKLCMIAFDDYASYNKHCVDLHARYACAQCPRTFTTRNNMWRHARNHSNTREWVCTSCGKAFMRSDILQEHTLTHTSNYHIGKCFCGEEISKKSSLLHHLKKCLTLMKKDQLEGKMALANTTV